MNQTHDPLFETDRNLERVYAITSELAMFSKLKNQLLEEPQHKRIKAENRQRKKEHDKLVLQVQQLQQQLTAAPPEPTPKTSETIGAPNVMGSDTIICRGIN